MQEIALKSFFHRNTLHTIIRENYTRFGEIGRLSLGVISLCPYDRDNKPFQGSDRVKVRRKAGLKNSRNNNHLENAGTLSTKGKSELAQKTGSTQNIYTKEVGIIRHR